LVRNAIFRDCILKISVIYLIKLNIKDCDEEKYILSDFREKMAGANLHEGNIEGASEL